MQQVALSDHPLEVPRRILRPVRVDQRQPVERLPRHVVGVQLARRLDHPQALVGLAELQQHAAVPAVRPGEAGMQRQRRLEFGVCFAPARLHLPHRRQRQVRVGEVTLQRHRLLGVDFRLPQQPIVRPVMKVHEQLLQVRQRRVRGRVSRIQARSRAGAGRSPPGPRAASASRTGSARAGRRCTRCCWTCRQPGGPDAAHRRTAPGRRPRRAPCRGPVSRHGSAPPPLLRPARLRVGAHGRGVSYFCDQTRRSRLWSASCTVTRMVAPTRCTCPDRA